jgi:PKHD-type hydroxylase
MEYGAHIDSPRMQDVRCDVAVTVCLSDSYSGGELVVDVDGASVTWKGSIGDCVVYAADTTHMVTPVGHGVREVAVFWVQSLVRNPAHRRLLFDLRTALDEAQHGTNNTPAHIAKLERIYANLVRYWI